MTICMSYGSQLQSKDNVIQELEQRLEAARTASDELKYVMMHVYYIHVHACTMHAYYYGTFMW